MLLLFNSRNNYVLALLLLFRPSVLLGPFFPLVIATRLLGTITEYRKQALIKALFNPFGKTPDKKAISETVRQSGKFKSVSKLGPVVLSAAVSLSVKRPMTHNESLLSLLLGESFYLSHTRRESTVIFSQTISYKEIYDIIINMVRQSAKLKAKNDAPRVQAKPVKLKDSSNKISVCERRTTQSKQTRSGKFKQCYLSTLIINLIRRGKTTSKLTRPQPYFEHIPESLDTQIQRNQSHSMSPYEAIKVPP